MRNVCPGALRTLTGRVGQRAESIRFRPRDVGIDAVDRARRCEDKLFNAPIICQSSSERRLHWSYAR